jgi:predicted AAA+ superfamily ATPase
MQKLELLPLILNYQTFFQNSSDLIPREISTACQEGNEIKFILGPLHSGKTSLLKKIASDFIDSKIYIDFEDIQNKGFESNNFQLIEEISAEICKKESEKSPGKNCYFLDEIDNIPEWEHWVYKLHKQGSEVFITSSSSNLLTSEFFSRFEGKNKILRLFPLSFKEYLLMKGIRISKPNLLPPSLNDETLCLFLQYFENGGFPAVAKNGNIQLCQKYFEDFLEKGVAARYDIRNIKGLKELVLFLVSNTASEYSLDTLKKVSGIENEETINLYLDYLEEIFLFYRIPKLNSCNRREEKIDASQKSLKETDIPCKVYVGDTGFFKAVCPNYPDSLGLRFENLVFLELLRRGKQIFYGGDSKECDFLIKEKDSQTVSAALQVSIYFGGPAVREREILGLMEALDFYGLSEGLILTMDDNEVLQIEGKTGKKKIIVKSAWRWMLE